MPSQSSTLLLCAFCAVLPVLMVLSTTSLPVALGVAAILAIWAARRDGIAWAPPRGPLVWLCLLLLLWAALASLWSFRVERALLLALRLGALGLAGGILIAIAMRLQPSERARVARWLCIGFALGLAIFLFERLTGGFLHNLSLDPGRQRTALSILNRAATGLALLVWPVTAVLYRGAAGRLAWLLPIALLGLLFFYESQAAIIGVAAGCVMLLFTQLSSRAAMMTAIGILLVAILAGPLIADWAPVPTVYESGWIADSAKHRLHVWDFAADRIYERPLFGWGFDSSHKMPNMGVEPFGGAKKVIPAHPHNAVLQIWLELGLVGALIALALLLSVWRLIDRLAGFDQAAAVALFVAGFAVACISYGIWQSKWIATLIALGLVVVASRGESGGEDRGAARAKSDAA